MADNFSATEIARTSTIAEQNIIIAAAYDALIAARTQLGSFQTVDAAIERIENWRQKRDPLKEAIMAIPSKRHPKK